MVYSARVAKITQAAKLLQIGSPEEAHKRAAQQETTEELDLLRAWQSRRLAATYADYLAQPRYRSACLFFLNDVYSAKDFRKRDNEIKHLYEILHHFLPDALLVLVKTVIELDALTGTLDEALWDVLEELLGVDDAITPQLYARAYRICDNYDERAYQIELIYKIGQMVETTTRIPMIATLLKLARRPVTSAGWGDLHKWIERGFNAFLRMHGADEFLDAIHDREMAILDGIFESEDATPALLTVLE